MDAAGIFATDVRGIDWADGLVAITDGPDPDSGTSWEVGRVRTEEMERRCPRPQRIGEPCQTDWLVDVLERRDHEVVREIQDGRWIADGVSYVTSL